MVYINREKTFFNFLSNKFTKTENIRISSSFLPKEVEDNLVEINYTSTGDIWFIRLPLSGNEILYYFGVSKNYLGSRSSRNKDIFLRLILKVNDNYYNVMREFFESDDIAIEITIEKNFTSVHSFLKKKFDFISSNNRYFINLGKINSNKFMLNIRNLLKLVEFDLNLNNDVLVVKGIIKHNYKFKSQKLNDDRNIQHSNEEKRVKPNINSRNKKKNYSKTSIKQTNSSSGIRKNSFLKPHNKKTIIKNSNKIKKSTNNLNNKEVINETLLSDTEKNNLLEKHSEIFEALDEGYKYIIVESNDEKVGLIKLLTEKYNDLSILTSNKYSQNNYKNNFKLMKNHKIDVFQYDEFAKNTDSTSNFKKCELLFLDEAHRIEEKIANYLSYDIYLSDYNDELINNFTVDIKKIGKKDYKIWLDFIKYLSLDNLKINLIVKYIKENPQNWICDYNESYNILSFQPLDISNFVKEYYLDNGNVCIFMSSSILDYKKFFKELNLDPSDVKIIHKDLPFESDKNKIYTRNSFDMSQEYIYETSEYLIHVIKEILNKHKHQKGIIYCYNSSLKNLIFNNIKNPRLLTHSNENFEINFKKFKNSENSIFVSDLIDSVDFPNNNSEFQIIVKQPVAIWDSRAREKDKLESNWYDYQNAINIVQLFQRTVKSTKDYCVNYILDEKFQMFISRDIAKNKYISENILMKIVDFDINPREMISNLINKQFGVYYLYDYIPKKKKKDKVQKYALSTKRNSEKLRNYKKYDKKYPHLLKDAFDFFNNKLLESVVEFSNEIISDEINKIALVAVPSSTIERDNSSTMRESIKFIENCYNGKLNSNFVFEKEIIDCSDLLYRFSDVKPSHLKGRRVSYMEHMNSIKCGENKIFNMDNVAFIIMDDITTRGTILNACEDILVKNGVNRENIYKFVIGKTVGFDD